MPEQNTRLELLDITKTYPGVTANYRVNMSVMKGEIHALLGENGAGKSTLVKCIYGVQKADSGNLFWEGQKMQITSPAHARNLGIGMVFQNFSLFDAMTVGENIALGISADLVDGNLDKRIRKISTLYGLPLDPNRYVYTLSVGERQRIEVVRCLLQDPQLLIMDEPTSVLTPQEVEKLFETLKNVANEGVSILYISHKLEEIRALCHTATIMRMGKVVTKCIPRNETTRSMAEMMMGEHLVSPKRNNKIKGKDLKLKTLNLTSKTETHQGTNLENINIQIHSGEILGIAGIAGNGQRELMEVLSGEKLCEKPETIEINGNTAGHLDSVGRRLAGVGVIPEERLGHGAVPYLSLWENAFLSAAKRMQLSKQGFIRIGSAMAFAQSIVDLFRVKTPTVKHTANSLSGGNLQKFIVGREILQDPEVIIAMQPTWGVDAGSAAAIRQSLIDLASNGTAILAISQDLDELFEISDRISVICEGRISEPQPVEEITVEEIGLLMVGAR